MQNILGKQKQNQKNKKLPPENCNIKSCKVTSLFNTTSFMPLPHTMHPMQGADPGGGGNPQCSEKACSVFCCCCCFFKTGRFLEGA